MIVCVGDKMEAYRNCCILGQVLQFYAYSREQFLQVNSENHSRDRKLLLALTHYEENSVKRI